MNDELDVKQNLGIVSVFTSTNIAAIYQLGFKAIVGPIQQSVSLKLVLKLSSWWNRNMKNFPKEIQPLPKVCSTALWQAKMTSSSVMEYFTLTNGQGMRTRLRKLYVIRLNFIQNVANEEWISKARYCMDQTAWYCMNFDGSWTAEIVMYLLIIKKTTTRMNCILYSLAYHLCGIEKILYSFWKDKSSGLKSNMGWCHF